MKRFFLLMGFLLCGCSVQNSETATTEESSSSAATQEVRGPTDPAVNVDCFPAGLNLPLTYRGEALEMLCNEGYGAMYSEADRLTRAVLEQLKPEQGAVAKEGFTPDTRTHSSRATTQDYKGSSFEGRQLAPAADFASPLAQHESFLLSNVAPQNPQLNQLWTTLETATRACAAEKEEITVITGTLGNAGKIADRIVIPSAFFKLWYSHAQQDYRLWVIPNISFEETNGTGFSPYEVPLYQFREYWNDFPQTSANENNYGSLCGNVIPLTTEAQVAP